MNFKQTSNKSSAPVQSTALAAVAFQDHLLRDLSIGNLSLAAPQVNKKPSLTERLRLQEKRRKIALKKAKPTIDTGIKTKIIQTRKVGKKDEIEYVLDPCPRPLTLAQKMGLIPHDKDQEKLLSENEWLVVKESSLNREDFKNPCVICKDDFRLEDQVLLSCSHVFHRACLQAFERFTGRKSCPMCRHKSYQTRVVHDGTRVFKHKSAAKIQAYWRGHVIRKWYRELRRTVPPNDPNLRRKFYQDKLSEITDRIVAMTSSDRIDRFLENIDESVAHSRNIFQYFENSRLTHLSEDDWTNIEVRASERAATECPICLRSLALETESTSAREISEQAEERFRSRGEPIALLSCTHVYHATCLNALETFSLDDDLSSSHNERYLAEAQMDTSEGRSPLCFKCPVCRSFYLKRIIHV